MDVVTRVCVCVLAGLALAPGIPGSRWSLVAVCIGAAAIACPRRGWGGRRGLGFALALGLTIGGTQPPGPVLEGEVVVLGSRVGASLGRRGDVAVTRWAPAGGPWRPATGRVRVQFAEGPPAPGTAVIVIGRGGPVPRTLPGAPDPVRAAALARIRTEIRARRTQVLGPQGRPALPADPTGMLAAMALGDRSGVDRETMRILRRTGTAHLLAISGFHVGVVAALASALATAGLRGIALVRPTGVSGAWAGAIGVVAAWSYAQAAGAPLSAQRAAGLLLLVALGRSMGRRTDAVPLLALVATAMGVADPSALATPSFQLSFGAVLGLVCIGPRLAHALPPLPWGTGWMARGMIATASSTLGTLPAAAWWFQEVAPLSPLANLVALPLTGFVIVPAAAVATWGPPGIDGMADGVGSAAAHAMIAILEAFVVAPFTPAVGPVGAVALAGGLILALRRPVLGIGLVALTLAWPVPRGGPLRFTFLDVGQGDATFVEFPDGQRWLIDGGTARSGVVGWLRRHQIRHLDVVVATHGEWDHYGGLLPVLDGVSVGALWAHRPPEVLSRAAAAAGVPVRSPMGALWPRPDDLDGWSDNDRSIVLGIGPVILPGDLEARGEAEVTPLLPTTYPVLKLGHHGSRTSTTAPWLAAVAPRIAVVSSGIANPYGHPHDDVLDRLKAAGTVVLRTDRDGTVVIEVTPDGSIRYRTAAEAGVVGGGDQRDPIENSTNAPAAKTMDTPWL